MLEPNITGHALANDPKIGRILKCIPFKRYRKCNRDGNCLYTSIALQIFPLLQERDFRTIFFSFVDCFEHAGFSNVVYESFMESISDVASTKSIDDLTQDDLNSFVGYLRLIVSAHLRANEEDYHEFLGCPVKTYARRSVEPMGQRAGHVEIVALSRSLPLEITIYDVNSGKINEMKFGEGHPVSILHTPDHFEPVYR